MFEVGLPGRKKRVFITRSVKCTHTYHIRDTDTAQGTYVLSNSGFQIARTCLKTKGKEGKEAELTAYC